MGIVYKAEQVGLNRAVALKMILRDRETPAEERARFQCEAEAVARLRHPHIVQIYEIGSAGDVPYFSLEFVDGGTLAGRLANGPLPPGEAAGLIESVARAMHYAHQQAVIHRDLKPANVLLTADGQPKVADFGLAKNLNAAGQTQSGAILGTPSYMPPEQAAGRKEIGPAADVYALGAILYHCLTGRPPFRGATVAQTLEQVRTLEPVPPTRLNRSLPRAFEVVCLKCLRKEPARRYNSALELAEDLARARVGDPVHAQAETLVGKALRAGRRHLLSVLIVAGVIELVGIQTGLLLGLFAITSLPIDHTKADIWVSTPYVTSVDLGRPMPASLVNRIVALPEIERCEVYLQGFLFWSKPKSGSELCMVIGSCLLPDSLGKIDKLTEEQCDMLAEEGTVLIDESEAKKLGVEDDRTAEINGQQVSVVGMTHGLPSLAGPYVLCSIPTARRLLRMPADETTYVLARCRSREDAPRVVERLNQSYADMTAFTARDFARRTQLHWLLRTKAGIALGYAMLLILTTGCILLWVRFDGQAVARLRAGSVRDEVALSWRIAAGALGQSLGVGLAGAVLGVPCMIVTGLCTERLLGVALVTLPSWLVVSAVSVSLGMSLVAGLVVVLRVFWLQWTKRV
jgi:hypothetical protein